jgi:DNA polymerase III subunit epsilon
MRQIVLDTETTGLSALDGDRILEIGCVELLHRKLTGNNFHRYINPERDSHEEALKVHGITNEFLADKPKFAAISAELVEYLSGAELIIHNASFDVGFLDKEFERVGLPAVKQIASGVIDTLAMAKDAYPGKRNSLDALCDRLGVDNSNRTLHGALLDAELLADVYIAMTRGQEGLLMDMDESEPGRGGQTGGARIDLSTLNLPVLVASDTEQSAHESVIAEIGARVEGGAVWTRE